MEELNELENNDNDILIETEIDNSLLESINDKLDTIIEGFDIIQASSSAILSYAVFYIPLLMIVISLWWFFKQFIERYR